MGSRSRNQGQDWETLPQLSLPHTVETRRPHGILTASLRVGMVVTPTVQRRKLRHRTGTEAKSHSQHTTWQGCVRNLGSPAPEFPLLSPPLPQPSPIISGCDHMGSCGVYGGLGLGLQPECTHLTRSGTPGCVRVRTHVCTSLAGHGGAWDMCLLGSPGTPDSIRMKTVTAATRHVAGQSPTRYTHTHTHTHNLGESPQAQSR